MYSEDEDDDGFVDDIPEDPTQSREAETAAAELDIF
jgi:hypothetical protein